MNNTFIQRRQSSLNINPQLSIYGSPAFVQQYKQIQFGLKQIKIQDQNLHQNIQVQKQRLLRNFSTVISPVTKFHVRSNSVANNYIRQSMIINKSKIINSSNINKSQVYDQKLIQTIQQLQKIIEMYRFNQKGYKKQIQSLIEQITYMKSIIQQRQTLIAKHTKQIQVVRQNGNCQQCLKLKKQIHILHQRYIHQIQRIKQASNSNQIIIVQRKIKQFQTLIIEKDTIIKKLEHQLKAFTDKVSNKGGQKEVRQKLIAMEFQVTKLNQALSKRDKQKSQYEQIIKQFSQKYDTLVTNMKSKEDQFSKILKFNHQMKVQIQILQSQIERLNNSNNKSENQKKTILKKIQTQKYELEQQIITLRFQNNTFANRLQRIKNESQQRIRFISTKQIQEKTREKRIEQLSTAVRQRDTQIFSLREQIRKMRKQSTQKEKKDDTQVDTKTNELIEQNKKLSFEIYKFKTLYQQIKVKYDQIQHTMQTYQIKIQNYSRLQMQIQTLKKQNYDLSQKKFTPIELGGSSSRKIINIELQQQNSKIKQELSQLRRQIGDQDILTKWLKNQQQIKILMSEIERLKNHSQNTSKGNESFRIVELQKTVFNLQTEIKRLKVFENKKYEYQQKVTQIQPRDNSQSTKLHNKIRILETQIQRLNIVFVQKNSSSVKQRQNHDQCHKQISKLKEQVDRLTIIKSNSFKQAENQITKQNQNKLLEAQNQLTILQTQIDRLTTFESRYTEIQKYQKLEQRFQIIQKLINQVLRIYKISSFEYNLETYSNIPHYLSQLISIFINLHKKTFEMGALIQSFQTQILQLKKINIEVQQTNYQRGNLVQNIQALQNKIRQLKSSNEFYIRINNSLSSKLQTSQMERQFIFNQFVTTKEQLQKLEHQTIIKNNIFQSENISTDVGQLRERIHQIESVTAVSMDKMRQYYQKIQSDIDFQLGDMKNTVNMLQENNIDGKQNNIDKYKKIILKLQVDVNQLQISYKSFQVTVNSNIKSTNQQIIQITNMMNQKIENFIQNRKGEIDEDKNRLQIQLQDAQKYIQNLTNQKNQFQIKINELKAQFDTMKKETEKINLNYNEAVSKSQTLKREKQQMKITIQQIANQKAEIQRQFISKIKQQTLHTQSQQQTNILGQKLRQAENSIAQLLKDKQSQFIKQNIINELNSKYQTSLFQKHYIQQNLITIQIKVRKLEQQKIRLDQNNKYLHNRCKQLEGEIQLINQKRIQQNKEGQSTQLNKARRELTQVISKLIQAENYIAKIQSQINRLLVQNQKLQQGVMRLEAIEKEYQKAIEENNNIQKALIEVQKVLISVNQQKHKIQQQYNQIKNQCITLQKTIEINKSQSRKINKNSQSQSKEIQQQKIELFNVILKLKEAERHIFNMQQERNLIIGDVNQLVEQNKNLLMKISILEQTIQSQNELKVTRNPSSYQVQLNHLQNLTRGLQSQKLIVIRQNRQLKEKCQQIKQQLYNVSKTTNSQIQNKNLQMKQEQIKGLSTKLNQAKQYIRVLEKIKESLVRENITLADEKQMLIKSQQSINKQEIQIYKKQIERQRQYIITIENQNKSLLNKPQKFVSTNEENNANEKRNKQVLSALAQQQTLNQGYEKQITNPQVQVRKHKIQLQDFTNIIDNNNNHDQCKQFLQQCVDQINILENNSQVLAQELNNIITHQRYLQEGMMIIPQKITQFNQFKQNDRQSNRINNSQMPSLNTYLGHRREASKSSDINNQRDDLLNQLKELSQHIQIYHKQWNRKKQVCFQMALAALNENQILSQQYENLSQQSPQIKVKQLKITQRLNQISKILNILSNELQPQQNFKNDLNQRLLNINQDNLVGDNLMRIVESDRLRGYPSDQQFSHALNNLKNSISKDFSSKQSSLFGLQTQNDPKF